MLTAIELSHWTSEHSVYGEMIFQMLSRGTYSCRRIARYVGCPVEAVKLVAAKRFKAIAMNHRLFL